MFSHCGPLCTGLAKKRAMLGVGPSPTLLQLLKEAKTEGAAQIVGGGGGELDSAPVPLNYSRLFDEYHGEGWTGRWVVGVPLNTQTLG